MVTHFYDVEIGFYRFLLCGKPFFMSWKIQIFIIHFFFFISLKKTWQLDGEISISWKKNLTFLHFFFFFFFHHVENELFIISVVMFFFSTSSIPWKSILFFSFLNFFFWNITNHSTRPLDGEMFISWKQILTTGWRIFSSRGKSKTFYTRCKIHHPVVKFCGGKNLTTGWWFFHLVENQKFYTRWKIRHPVVKFSVEKNLTTGWWFFHLVENPKFYTRWKIHHPVVKLFVVKFCHFHHFSPTNPKIFTQTVTIRRQFMELVDFFDFLTNFKICLNGIFFKANKVFLSIKNYFRQNFDQVIFDLYSLFL